MILKFKTLWVLVAGDCYSTTKSDYDQMADKTYSAFMACERDDGRF